MCKYTDRDCKNNEICNPKPLLEESDNYVISKELSDWVFLKNSGRKSSEWIPQQFIMYRNECFSMGNKEIYGKYEIVDKHVHLKQYSDTKCTKEMKEKDASLYECDSCFMDGNNSISVRCNDGNTVLRKTYEPNLNYKYLEIFEDEPPKRIIILNKCVVDNDSYLMYIGVDDNSFTTCYYSDNTCTTVLDCEIPTSLNNTMKYTNEIPNHNVHMKTSFDEKCEKPLNGTIDIIINSCMEEDGIFMKVKIEGENAVYKFYSDSNCQTDATSMAEEVFNEMKVAVPSFKCNSCVNIEQWLSNFYDSLEIENEEMLKKLNSQAPYVFVVCDEYKDN